MRVLLDTNLLIGREDPEILREDLGGLLRTLFTNEVTLFVHPGSIRELERDPDTRRRDVTISKARSYPLLEDPPKIDDGFVARAGGSRSNHDLVDIQLLRAVDSNAVSFLITEDQDLISRAPKVGIGDRVLSIALAVEYFAGFFGKEYPVATPYLRRSHLYTIDPSDHFFDSFREDYPDFDKWLRRVTEADRLCYKSDLPGGGIGSILILKEGDSDLICSMPVIPRLKICSLKVSAEQSGFRLGETLIGIALEFAYRNHISECYVTVFPKYGELTALLATLGFEKKCSLANGELVMFRSLSPPPLKESVEPVEFLRSFFPWFREDPAIRKFVIPIRPEYHRLLFPRYGGSTIQRRLDGGWDLPPPGGNAIRKAYLCNSNTGRVRPGDLGLFYRSGDRHGITHLGVVEQTRTCTSVEEIVDFVGNRTVLPESRLEQMCKSRVLAILFWNWGTLEGGITIQEMERIGVPWPQSIVEIDHEAYRQLVQAEPRMPSSFR